MNSINEAKNALYQCATKTALFEKLDSLCANAGYHYDFRRSMASNARCASESCRYGVAEIIKHAEKIAEKL